MRVSRRVDERSLEKLLGLRLKAPEVSRETFNRQLDTIGHVARLRPQRRHQGSNFSVRQDRGGWDKAGVLIGDPAHLGHDVRVGEGSGADVPVGEGLTDPIKVGPLDVILKRLAVLRRQGGARTLRIVGCGRGLGQATAGWALMRASSRRMDDITVRKSRPPHPLFAR
jgi:hypothetical protein